MSGLMQKDVIMPTWKGIRTQTVDAAGVTFAL